MRSIQYVSEPGMILDAIALLAYKCNTSKVKVDFFLHKEEILQKCKCFLQEDWSGSRAKVKLFCYKPTQESFSALWNFYNEIWSHSNGPVSLDNLRSRLNESAFIRSIYRYYLHIDDISMVDEAQYRDYILQNNPYLPSDIQVELLGFMIEPQSYISLLKESLAEAYCIIEEIQGIEKQVDQQITLPQDQLQHLFNVSKVSLSDMDSAWITFSCIFENENFYFKNHNNHFWVLGVNWWYAPPILTVLMKYLPAISDETRLKIVKELLTGEEVTNASLANTLQLANSSITHHLRIMKEAGLVYSYKRKKNSKKECLMLNSFWFRDMAKKLMEIYERVSAFSPNLKK